MKNTHYVSLNETDLPKANDPHKRHITYYQWIPLLLVFQVCLCVLYVCGFWLCAFIWGFFCVWLLCVTIFFLIFLSINLASIQLSHFFHQAGLFYLPRMIWRQNSRRCGMVVSHVTDSCIQCNKSLDCEASGKIMKSGGGCCLSINLAAYPSIHLNWFKLVTIYFMFIYSSSYLNSSCRRLSIHPSLHPSIHPSTHSSIYHSLHPSIHSFIPLSIL